MHLPTANALFPFDSSNRLRRQIVENSVDAVDLGGDALGYLMENRVGDLLDGGAHSVLGVYGADDRGPALVAALVLNAYRLDVGDNNEILPYLLGKAALIKLVAEDSVCLAESCESVTGDSTEVRGTADGKP